MTASVLRHLVQGSALALTFAIPSLALGADAIAPGAVPSVVEVLDQYAATQKALERCRIVTDAKVVVDFRRVPSLRRQRIEYRRDGARAACVVAGRRPEKFDDPMPDALPEPTAANEQTFGFVTTAVSSPEGIVSYFRLPEDRAFDRVEVETTDDPERLELPMPHTEGAGGSFMRGWLPQDETRIDQTLREAKGARAAADTVDGRPCVLVNVETDRGRFDVWFDTSRGGNIVRARIERGPRHRTRDGVLWETMRRRTRAAAGKTFEAADEKVLETSEFTDVELKRFGDVWLPVEMTCLGDAVDREGDHFKVDYRLRARIDLDPIFAPGDFTVPAPEGTKVMLRAGNDVIDPGLEWRDGRAQPVR